MVDQVVQQLSQVKDLEITDVRKGKQDFGKYLFGTYKQNPCMIKIISIQDDQLVSSQNKLQRVFEKVNRLKMCSHKSILKYYDSFQIEDNFYIVMEKVECSLKQWIDDNRKNQIEKVLFLKFALQMFEVADYLHQKKYILSNINLKNIFLDRDLNIKFSTFTVKQEVSVYKLLKQQVYALENNELIYFPLCLIEKGDKDNLIMLSSQQDMYAIGLCLYCLTGVSYMDVLNYIQGGKFQVNLSLGIDINQLLQLMLLRNGYSFVPTCCYFIQSLQKLIEKGKATLQIDKDEEIQQLKLFQEVVNKIDGVKEQQDELLGDKEKKEEIENEGSSTSQEKLRQLIQKYQNCDIYYFFEGYFHERNYNDEQSLLSFKMALELNEKNDVAMYQLGLAYNELGLTQESLECYIYYFNQKNQIICKQKMVDLVVQQLSQVKDLEITDIRKGKENFGKYLFGIYKQNPCMIKIISIQDDQLASQQKKQQRVSEKVNRLKTCSHKNILKYYGSFQIEDNFYIIMEKVEYSLQQWIDANRKNQIEKVQFLKFALQMAEVADYLHQKKYILSNINLKNIFLDRDLNINFSTFTVKQEVSVHKLLKKQVYALENNELIYFPLCLIEEGDNDNLVMLSSKQDMYAIGLCLYCLTGVSYMDVLNYIQGEIVNKIDDIKEKQDELQGVKEKSEEIENENSTYLEKLRQLIQKYQNCDIYYFFEGYFHSNNNNDEQSLHSYKIALELNEKNDIALYEQGLVFNELGLTQESLECYYQFCRLNPLDDEVYSNIGEIFLNKQDYKRSKKYFEASLAINPRQYVAYLNIGQVYFQQKMFEKAAYYFKKTNKIKSDADTYYLLGYYYDQKKDYEKSLNSYKKSYYLSNQNDLPYINLINNIKSLI
ncbi:hypothetical protein ABPG73_010072 [Tetrahymena malaccensis]